MSLVPRLKDWLCYKLGYFYVFEILSNKTVDTTSMQNKLQPKTTSNIQTLYSLFTALLFCIINFFFASLNSSWVKMLYKCSSASFLALSSEVLIFSSVVLIFSSTTRIWLTYKPMPKAPLIIAPNATICCELSLKISLNNRLEDDSAEKRRFSWGTFCVRIFDSKCFYFWKFTYRLSGLYLAVFISRWLLLISL